MHSICPPRCNRYEISIAKMLVVVVHPWRENFEQIEIEYSEDMVRRVINRQNTDVSLAQNAHREA